MATEHLHEDLNRARKHSALLLAVDAWLSQRGIDPLTDEGCSALALVTHAQWKVLAILAQTGEPSQTTLGMLAESYRRRADILARMKGADAELASRCAAEIEKAGRTPSIEALAARASWSDEARREHDDALHAHGAGR